MQLWTRGRWWPVGAAMIHHALQLNNLEPAHFHSGIDLEARVFEEEHDISARVVDADGHLYGALMQPVSWLERRFGTTAKRDAETKLDTATKRDAAASGPDPEWIWPPKRGERCHRCHQTDNTTRCCALCNPRPI